MKVTIYVEGGGDEDKLKRECRRAFSLFFEKAGLAGRMPKIVASGSRSGAYDRFCTALRQPTRNHFVLLLVDSESAVDTELWQHLQIRDGWQHPGGAADDQAHLMVQCMEAWFLADAAALERYYGQGFKSSKLPKLSKNVQVEQIDKQVLFDALAAAVRETKFKHYHKRNAFGVLALVDPHKVIAAAPHAKRLVETVDSHSRR